MLVLVILQLIFPVISILHFLFIHPFRRRSTVNLKSTLVRLQLGALVPAFVANVGLVIESTLRAVYYFNPNLTALNLRWVPVYSYLGIYVNGTCLAIGIFFATVYVVKKHSAMAVGKTQNILYICLVILGILGCAFLSSLFLTNTSVDDVYGWVHYYRFITSTLYIGVGNLIVNVVEEKWVSMILEQYIPTQTSHNSERPPAASVVEMQRKKSFVYNRILISKNAQMTERERTKFIAGYAIFAILSATAMVVGVCAEWLEYPFLNGDLINIGISLTCICGTQMLSQLHALHESIARLKQRQKMIPLRTKKINESFTSSEEVSVLPPALTADDSSIRSSNISSSSFSDLGPKNGHSSSFIANPGRIFVKCPSDRRFAKTLSSSANNPKSSSSNNNNFVTDEFEVIVEEENSY